LFKKDNLETPPDKVNTIIGKDTFFNGTIHGKGLIRIDGAAEGSIINKGDVIIGEGGKVSVDLKARNITIAGHYEGTLEAEGRLELKRTATASGTFKTNGLLIEEGAVLCGNMEMKMKEQPKEGKTKYDFGYKADENEKPVKPETI
jgi:cytoskeletal protein CcmA (bactofilin family)